MSWCAQAQAHHINLLASIGNSVPQWANGSSDWRQPPSDLNVQPMQNTAWYQYVYAFVQRYNGDGVDDMPGLILPIKSWEFWNEPDLREGGTRPTIRRTNSPATPISSCGCGRWPMPLPRRPTPAPPWWGRPAPNPPAMARAASARCPGFSGPGPNSSAAGGLNTLDAVSFTHYFFDTNWDVPDFDEPDFILSLADHGRGGKPVWLTETGWQGDPSVNYDIKARDLVRLSVLMWSVPWVQHVFWYDFQEQSLLSSSNHHGLIQTVTGPGATGKEPDPLFHPAYRAADLMQHILAGFGVDDHPALLEADSARVYHFAARGQEAWVAWWRPDSGSGVVNIDTGGRTTRMIGLYGQDLGLFSGGALTLTPDPIYLTTNLDWNANVGRITGRLRDASQPGSFSNGVIGATVAITGPGGLAQTTQSDSDGNYQFSGLPDGDYHVSVQGFPASPASYDLHVDRQLFWGQTSFAVTLSP